MEKQQFLQLDFGLEFEKPEKEQPPNPKQDETNFVFDMMDCLTSPIIVHRCGWMDTIPQDLRANIPIARMMAAMAKEKMATVPEVVAYLMPRSFEAPMPYGWANIYTWAGLQYAIGFRSKEQQELMREIAPKELSSDEKRDMDHLRRWIYEKRRKALKIRAKPTKRPVPNNEKGNQLGLL